MTPFALALMLTSMGLVTALEIYCLWRLLSPRREEISGNALAGAATGPDADADSE